MELLASLGDVTRIEKLRQLAAERTANRPWLAEGAVLRDEPKVTEPKSWKTTIECHAAAQSASVQITSTSGGILPAMGVGRRDVVDRRMLELAMTKLRDATTSTAEREVALGTIAAWSGPLPRYEAFLAALVDKHDAIAVRRVLDAKITHANMLGPELVAALWTLEESRDALVAALARNSADDWSARATAAERAAKRAGTDEGGLFEAWALAIVEHSAASTAAETETIDQLHIVIREAVNRAAPIRAVALYEDLLDDFSASLFIKALKRLPRDRQAALRDAGSKLRFNGERGAARKAWLMATRPEKKIQEIQENVAESP
jgi:hypothetical protein